MTTIQAPSGSTFNDFYGGITNFAAGTGTLAICNNVPQLSTIEAQFHGVIGKSVLDQSTRPTNNAASNDNITLVLAASNNGTLTLGLANQGTAPSPPGNPLAQANTYKGGTFISGGALFAANGNTYWDGTHGMMNDGHGNLATSASASVLNSATGTGPVTVNQGGTLGGSKVGGAIGMPSTGAVTINNGGYLLPGGGYYNDSTGQGSASYAFNGSAGTQAVAVDPAFNPTVGAVFHVLGNLNLNNGANVNFNFGSSGSDLINVGGALNLAGSVNINLNAINGATIYNGSPLFTGFTTLTGGTANLATTSGVTFVKNGNEIDLLKPGRRLSRSGAEASPTAAAIPGTRRRPTSRRPVCRTCSRATVTP